MKRLIISEITLVSEIEKKGRKVTFDPSRTVIFGGNQTGKSSLLKSIYFAFGAEPAKQHPRWQTAEVKTLVSFSIDGVGYKVLRDGTYFAIFTGASKLIKAFNRVSGPLSDYFANLFDFGLILPTRDEQPETPPPAFLLLPFYMDQDASWVSTWSAFARLMQFANWKDSLVEYHTGIRNNAYYQSHAEFIRKQAELNVALGQEKGIRSVAKKLQEDAGNATFNLDPDLFSDQIKRLVDESNVLAVRENEFKTVLAKVGGDLMMQRSRLAIAERALSELSNDFKFLERQTSRSIECPTCGTDYENDFAVRFSIATDEDRVAEFIAQIRTEIARLETERDAVLRMFSLTSREVASIQAILLEKQGELTLKTVIESEGRRSAENLLNQQLENAISSRAEIENKVAHLKEELKGFDTKVQAAKDEIIDEYGQVLRANLSALSVESYSQRIFRTLNPAINETGSTLPRSILAYQFAILTLIAKRSPSTVFPIVIDSPNQQAQDQDSLAKILSFINENQPKDTQMILGLENDMGIDFGGTVVKTPDEKNHLLEKEQYEICHREIYGLLKTSLAVTE